MEIDGNKKIKGDTLGLRRIPADGGYRGETVRNTVRRQLRCDLEVVLRSDKRTDRFVPVPKRWIVERSLLRIS